MCPHGPHEFLMFLRVTVIVLLWSLQVNQTKVIQTTVQYNFYKNIKGMGK